MGRKAKLKKARALKRATSQDLAIEPQENQTDWHDPYGRLDRAEDYDHYNEIDDYDDEDEEPHLVILRGKDNQTGLVTITNPRSPQSGNGIDTITTPDRIYSWQKWKSINNNLTLGKNDSYNLTYGGNFPKGMLTKKVLKGGIMGLVVNLDLLPMGSEIYYIEETSQDKSLLLTLSTFRKEEDEFVQCRYDKLSAFPGKSRVAVGDEIINPVRYSYVELAELMTDLEMQNHDNDGGPNDETLNCEWIITTAPTFVELNETIPVGVASDGALVDPEDDEALYVEDHEILLDCSDIIRVIIEDTRSYGVPIRYKTSASYRESHNGRSPVNDQLEPMAD